MVRALQQCPEAAKAFVAAGHEIVCHGWRWIDYASLSTPRPSVTISGARRRVSGRSTGKPAGRLVQRSARAPTRAGSWSSRGGFLYDRDALNDELPYWVKIGWWNDLVVPEVGRRPTTTASTAILD